MENIQHQSKVKTREVTLGPIQLAPSIENEQCYLAGRFVNGWRFPFHQSVMMDRRFGRQRHLKIPVCTVLLKGKLKLWDLGRETHRGEPSAGACGRQFGRTFFYPPQTVVCFRRFHSQRFAMMKIFWVNYNWN